MRNPRLLLAPLIALMLAAAVPPAAAAVDPARGQQWGLDLVRAPEAWSTGRGAGTTIAVVDTGVDFAHEDLAGKLLAGRSFVDEPVQDSNGHGTHVAGIAAAATDNGRGIAGVAPEAKILPVRVLAGDGGGTSSGVANGVRWAADQGATVINLSLGPEVPLVFSAVDSSIVDAIDYAWRKGSVVVIAAGNNFVPVSEYGDVRAIVVGAVDRQDRRASYSTGIGGAMWSMAAPGGSGGENGVLSTYWEENKRNSYAYLSGTSMATPHVAGAAAVLRGLGLSPLQTVNRLLATAKDLGPAGKDNDFGAGRLDLAAAVAGLGAGGGAATKQSDPTASPSSTAAGGEAATTARRGSARSASPAPGATAGTAPQPAGDVSSTTSLPAAVAGPEDFGDPQDAEPGSDDAAARPASGSAGNAPLLILLAIALVVAAAYGGFRRLRRAP